jgi:rubredoxin
MNPYPDREQQLQRVGLTRPEEDRMAQPEEMYQCQMVNCGYIYTPDKGDRKGKIKKGTAFKDLPDDWRCPVCGASKAAFKPLAGPGSVAESDTAATESKPETTGKDSTMKKYVCLVCGYEYDPEEGDPANDVAPGTAWEDVPEDWTCPICGAGKEEFEEA